MKVVAGPTKWSAEHRCQCGATLQIEQDDVRLAYFGANWGGDTKTLGAYFECPVCGRDNEIEVPPLIWRAAEANREKKP